VIEAKYPIACTILCQIRTKTYLWKIWRKKFGMTSTVSKSIDGTNNENVIASNFAKYFSKSKGGPPGIDQSFADKFKTGLATYIGDYCLKPFVDDDLVDSVINRLSRGKSTGFDTLTCEHLQFCHPIVTCVITKLFMIMNTIGYVPDAFRRGIIIPIPKGGKKSKNDKVDSYRGITISPIISKVFVKCLLTRLEGYLTSSDRQFGFKRV